MLFFGLPGKRGTVFGALRRRRMGLLLILLLLSAGLAWARPVQRIQAEKAARGWLRENWDPMDQWISDALISSETVTDESGRELCFILHLAPEGFVILSADDEINPVIAFSSTGFVSQGEDNPLKHLLKKDMRNRKEIVQRRLDRPSKRERKSRRWKRLTEAEEQGDELWFPQELEVPPSLSDVRVDPFITTEWGQTNAAGGWCYNYYTPNHYPSGCVATSMALLMHFHRWPAVGIGGTYLGGDGYGGPYPWDQMPEIPAAGLTTAQREYIGRLCRDAGLSVNMSYSPGVSLANLYNTDKVLISTFKYSNSIYTENIASSGNDNLWVMINSNMDAQLPVFLAISRPEGAHAILVDGYGYNEGYQYHHLNMGWDGLDNAWYQLPDIDTSLRDYDTLDLCMYNIYPQGTGEIISGQVTDLSGLPYEGLQVSAWQGDTLIRQTTTNHRGVYAMTNMASNTTYRISLVMNGQWLEQTVTTGRSRDGNAVSGNCWGLDFTAPTGFGPPLAVSAVEEINSWHPTSIFLTAMDEDPYDPNNPSDPNFYHYIITSLPVHCDLYEPNVGLIETVPYPMVFDVNHIVECVPCPYYGGPDSFTFKVDDGGVFPTGGESNIATVSLNINTTVTSGFGIEPNDLTTLMMDTTSYYDERSQVIYLKDEIGLPRLITEMALHVGIPPGQPLRNWTVRMQHTDRAAYDDVNDLPGQFLTEGWTTVYRHDMPSQSGWVTLPFDEPFEYNGRDHLLIDFSYNNSVRGGPAGSYYFDGTPYKRVLTLASSTGNHGDPLTWNFWTIGGNHFLDRWVPSVKFTGPIVDRLSGDFDDTCDVNLPDMALFAKAWQSSAGDVNYNPACDLSAVKGVIDLEDLEILSGQWLLPFPKP
jgi:hypothetical protein